MRQLRVVVNITVNGISALPAGTHTVGIVAKGPGAIWAADTGQLSAVLPGVGACAVAGQVANLVCGNSLPIIGGQQLSPNGVIVLIGNRVEWRS